MLVTPLEQFIQPCSIDLSVLLLSALTFNVNAYVTIPSDSYIMVHFILVHSILDSL